MLYFLKHNSELFLIIFKIRTVSSNQVIFNYFEKQHSELFQIFLKSGWYTQTNLCPIISKNRTVNYFHLFSKS